jgi:hypothetical protein
VQLTQKPTKIEPFVDKVQSSGTLTPLITLNQSNRSPGPPGALHSTNQFRDFHAPVIQYSTRVSGIPIADARKLYPQNISDGATR